MRNPISLQQPTRQRDQLMGVHTEKMCRPGVGLAKVPAQKGQAGASRRLLSSQHEAACRCQSKGQYQTDDHGAHEDAVALKAVTPDQSGQDRLGRSEPYRCNGHQAKQCRMQGVTRIVM